MKTHILAIIVLIGLIIGSSDLFADIKTFSESEHNYFVFNESIRKDKDYIEFEYSWISKNVVNTKFMQSDCRLYSNVTKKIEYEMIEYACNHGSYLDISE